MPGKKNAKYKEWKIWIEKFSPFLRDNIILIGQSLGGTFWLKYLAQNKFPVKISQLHLIAAAATEANEPLGDFSLPPDLSKVAEQAGKIYLYHSQDDPVVPFSDLEIISAQLPSAEKIIFSDYQHLRIKEFPELIERIKVKG
jgi:predicted alpha/beta hydrolase family esterase